MLNLQLLIVGMIVAVGPLPGPGDLACLDG